MNKIKSYVKVQVLMHHLWYLRIVMIILSYIRRIYTIYFLIASVVLKYKLNKRDLMKKMIVFLVLQCINLCVFSQHLQFSGIVIEGDLASFQAKLATKGIRVNSAKSKEAPVGQRIYNGKFQGYNAEFTVYYSRKTSKVYKIKVYIESKNKDTILNILNKSRKAIEHKYVFNTDHDEDDDNHLHYQYIIYPSKESVESIGTIRIVPSYAYYIPDNATSFSNFQFAAFTITFEYEDALSFSMLNPSETEPRCLLRQLSCNPENYSKFLVWANNFGKHECYENCIDYLTCVLDYYKYGCAPQNTEEYEDIIERAIISLKNNQIGRIKTAYYKEYANVYAVLDNSSELKCIEYGVNSDLYHVKLNANAINSQISALEELKRIYIEKKQDISEIVLNEFWREDISLTMPALIGIDFFSNNELGDIRWRECELTMEFCHYEQELRVTIEFPNYKFGSTKMPLLQFCNETEIEDYLNFLKVLLVKFHLTSNLG